jgi:hypothetical protein
MTTEQLDAALNQTSNEIFPLDPIPKDILKSIAERGPQTIYELYRNTKWAESAIRKYLLGDRKVPRVLSLLKEKYVRIEGVVPFKKIRDREMKYYGLDFKGFLASLTEVPCDRNYMFQVFLGTYEDEMGWSDDPLPYDEKTRIKNEAQTTVRAGLLAFLEYAKQELNLPRLKNVISHFLDLTQKRPFLFDGLPRYVGTTDPRTRNKTAQLEYRDWTHILTFCFLTRENWEPNPLGGKVGVTEHILKNYTEVIKIKRKVDELPWDAKELLLATTQN